MRQKALCALGAALLAAAGAGPAMAAGTVYSDTLTSNGETRSFTYHQPSGTMTDKPLVIALHGAGNSGAGFMNGATEGVWNDLSEDRKFWVVYPDGEEIGTGTHFWNSCNKATVSGDTDMDGAPDDGGFDPSTYNTGSLDDVQFISDLIDWFDTNKGIDTDRVYVYGSSDGGFMTLRLARELTGAFKAFAPAISSQYEFNECADPNSSTLQSGGRQMLFLYGDADSYVTTSAGCVSPPATTDCNGGRIEAMSDAIDYWKTQFGVDSSGSETAQANPVGLDFTRQYWTDHSRSSNLVLRVVRVDTGGHTVPGNVQNSWLARVVYQLGWRNLDINHIETTADFFGL
ncbi:MAG: hypothetical protein HXY25_07705 [Alphaproteobacteria bacterium]|nr:hypothetical protein [Alphaproteobacteria bacterium]